MDLGIGSGHRYRSHHHYLAVRKIGLIPDFKPGDWSRETVTQRIVTDFGHLRERGQPEVILVINLRRIKIAPDAGEPAVGFRRKVIKTGIAPTIP
jgi:hypothetical protein